MASHKSAEKRARQTEKRTLRNRFVKGQVKSAVRRFREALAANDSEKAKEAFQVATRQIRKAASKGVLHAKTASRRVSRLAQALQKSA